MARMEMIHLFETSAISGSLEESYGCYFSPGYIVGTFIRDLLRYILLKHEITVQTSLWSLIRLISLNIILRQQKQDFISYTCTHHVLKNTETK